MSDLMKVAYMGIKGLPSQAGADRVVEALVRRMPSLGVSPTVYCGTNFTPPDTVIPGTKLVRLSTIPGKHMRSTSLNIASAIHAVVLGDYDLVHLHSLEASFIIPFLRMRFPVIATSHGFAYRREKWGFPARLFLKWMQFPFSKFSTLATSVSKGDAEELERKYRRSVIFIPNGTGTEYSPDLNGSLALLKNHGLTPNKFLILVAGRIIPTKGIHLAIEAVNRLQEEIPLLIVGDHSQTPEYFRELKRLAGPRIRFQPLITNADLVFGLMSHARLLIFPSIFEAMSMVLLESASIDLPVICSDLPENRQVLGKHATYFASGDADSLLARLEWALEHPDELHRQSGLAKELVGREFTWDVIASRYLSLYQQHAKGDVEEMRAV